ncbi:SDR family NAD(P)-dependent oxidoreductase [Dactylosporangium sp. NPDC005572]|uniref:SDR family NAD(P)-dependent oxidoreductase n=1 Tax=Dactylosporangium sp. NPDC005572 TaxID=3156889 RepID=UPI0033BD24BA
MEIGSVTALITGGASGLGLATAERLIAADAAVVILDLPQSDGKGAVDRLGPRAAFAAGDVTDPEAVGNAVATAAEHGASIGKPLRVVVNCAGIGPPAKVVGRDGPFPIDLFRRTVEVNLVGTFNVIRLAAQHLLGLEFDGEERGVIVNTASVAAYDGQIGQAAYAASKAGIVGMTLPIARELARSQIRVNTIAPGLFATPLLESLPEAAQASLAQQVPHPSRLGRPSEYAALVEHIIVNPMINAETIRLDGGIRMAAR